MEVIRYHNQIDLLEVSCEKAMVGHVGMLATENAPTSVAAKGGCNP